MSSLSRYKCFAAVLAIAVLTACAGAPMVVDVSGSAGAVKAGNPPDRKALGAITVRNTAGDGTAVNTTLGSDSIFPIKPATKTKQTIETDLKEFLTSSFVTDPSSARSLSVTISKADSYWVWSSAAKVPFVGIAMAGMDTEFGMNLRVLFEVEEGGKVVSNYLFDEKIVIQGTATTEEAIRTSYQRLIAAYREKLFGELRARFVRRYF